MIDYSKTNLYNDFLRTFGEFMGRQKEFDQAIIVEKAMRLFWKTGYEGTSLQNLLKGLKILNGSFYHAFKNKKNLYLEALEIYNQDFVKKRNFVFEGNYPLKKKFEYFFEKIFDRQKLGECPKGCFLFNSVNTGTVSDAEIKKRLAKYIDELAVYLEKHIELAIKSGELNPKTDAKIFSRVMVNYMSGVMQMSTLDYNDAGFREQTKRFLDLVFEK